MILAKDFILVGHLQKLNILSIKTLIQVYGRSKNIVAHTHQQVSFVVTVGTTVPPGASGSKLYKLGLI